MRQAVKIKRRLHALAARSNSPPRAPPIPCANRRAASDSPTPSLQWSTTVAHLSHRLRTNPPPAQRRKTVVATSQIRPGSDGRMTYAAPAFAAVSPRSQQSPPAESQSEIQTPPVGGTKIPASPPGSVPPNSPPSNPTSAPQAGRAQIPFFAPPVPWSNDSHTMPYCQSINATWQNPRGSLLRGILIHPAPALPPQPPRLHILHQH